MVFTLYLVALGVPAALAHAGVKKGSTAASVWARKLGEHSALNASRLFVCHIRNMSSMLCALLLLEKTSLASCTAAAWTAMANGQYMILATGCAVHTLLGLG